MTMESVKDAPTGLLFHPYKFLARAGLGAYISTLPEFRRKVNMTLDIRGKVGFVFLLQELQQLQGRIC